jgi:hypothetical protein
MPMVSSTPSRREARMISKIISTGILVVLAAGAFVGQATFATQSDDGFFAVVGFLCVGLAVLNWSAWGSIREGWNYGNERGQGGPSLPAFAWSGPIYIKSIMNFLAARLSAGPESRAPGDRRDR